MRLGHLLARVRGFRQSPGPLHESGLPYPPLDLMVAIGSTSEENFDAIGREFVGHFRDLAGLDESSTVLDIGCGSGRMARQLMPVLEHGTYDGFDIDKRLIDWCEANIAPRNRRFRFKLIDVSNNYYNKDGTVRPEEASFPYPPAAFSLVTACSVFTHLVPGSASRYFEEVRRVMAPGGKCLFTAFLLNDESRALIADGKAMLAFKPIDENYSSSNPDASEAAIAIDEGWLRRELIRAGLDVVSVSPGAWCGRTQFLTSHDVLVVAPQAD